MGLLPRESLESRIQEALKCDSCEGPLIQMRSAEISFASSSGLLALLRLTEVSIMIRAARLVFYSAHRLLQSSICSTPESDTRQKVGGQRPR